MGQRLADAGVRVRVLRRPVLADGRRLVLADVIGGAEEVLEDVDALVHVRPPRARDELLDALSDHGFTGEVALIGDAHAPRSVLEAVYEGRLTGVGIGIGSGPSDLLRELGARDTYRLGAA
jgi:hypothetical protein